MGTADRSRDLSTRAGNKSRVRTSRRARLASASECGAESDSRCCPAARLPKGAPARRPGGAQRGPAVGLGTLQRPGLEASPTPLAAKLCSRAREPREGAGRWRGGSRTAKEIRPPGRSGRPPHPCGHGAGTCRHGCSSTPSFSASPAHHSPLSPPSRPPAHWTPPLETGSAHKPALIPGAAPGTVPPPPAVGPAFHWALELSVRPQKARGL